MEWRGLKGIELDTWCQQVREHGCLPRQRCLSLLSRPGPYCCPPAGPDQEQGTAALPQGCKYNGHAGRASRVAGTQGGVVSCTLEFAQVLPPDMLPNHRITLTRYPR
ncbi:hypothetical protein ACRRTK_008262 [Alexandromys fortis]